MRNVEFNKRFFVHSEERVDKRSPSAATLDGCEGIRREDLALPMVGRLEEPSLAWGRPGMSGRKTSRGEATSLSPCQMTPRQDPQFDPARHSTRKLQDQAVLDEGTRREVESPRTEGAP